MTIVRRASTGGASLPGETPPASLAESLRRLDFYAVDLREGSRVGGCLSILTTMTIAFLFFMQVSALMTPSYVTDIVVDHSPDARVAVNVRIDFPRCECAYLALDVVDALGWRSSVKNISGENIYKHPIGGPLKYMNLEHVSPAEEELDSTRRAADYGAWTTDFDHYGNRRISYDVVGEEMFDRMVRMHKLLLVNFHAPWCRHCQAFAPIWEHAAEMTKLELRRVGKPRLTLGLASVDCTASDNVALCDKLHIQAYPNVRIYRAGSLHPSKRAHASEDAQSEDSFQYEVYHGSRNAESLAKFADSLLREIESAEDDGSFSTNVGHDGDGDGRVDSALRSPGCSVNGNFHVNRVPWAFYFVPRSRAHSIADVDMTHVIKHLSFPDTFPDVRVSCLGISAKRGGWSLETWADASRARASALRSLTRTRRDAPRSSITCTSFRERSRRSESPPYTCTSTPFRAIRLQYATTPRSERRCFTRATAWTMSFADRRDRW